MKAEIKVTCELLSNTNINKVDSNSYSCKGCKISSDAEDVDELSKLVIKHLQDWKKGKYNKNSKYVRDLASNLQKIDVLFSRDIEKE